MNLERMRQICLALPGATEQIQWGADLVFKVGGKMFCVACTETAPNVMSCKCDDETFGELIEREGCIPAPYMARAKWVAFETWSTLEDREVTALVERAYQLIRASLPKKTQAALEGGAGAPAVASKPSAAKSQPAKRRVARAKPRAAAGKIRVKKTAARAAKTRKTTGTRAARSRKG